MKFLKYSFIALLTLVAIGSAGYLFAASGIQSKPGYAKLTLPSGVSANATLALNLGPSSLKPMRWMVQHAVNASDTKLELSERVLTNVLQDVQGMQLRIYEVEDNRRVFEQAITDSVISLKQKDWQTVLRVREDNNHIVVMQSGNEGSIFGLSLFASTPEHAVFINLMGPLNPESVAMIAGSLN